MKIIPTILFALTLLLCGCSVLLVPTWQEREYNELVQIAAMSTTSTCSQEENLELLNLSTHLVLYTEFLPHNEQIHKGMVLLHGTIQSLIELPQPISPTMCTFKRRIIRAMSRSLASASAEK